MTKLHHVKKARKARRRHGIRKGREYWWWKFRRLPKCFSAVKPRPSQLVRSPFEREILSVQESVEILNGEANDEAFRVAISDLEELKLQCEEKAENMSERFPNGCPTIDLLEERIEKCEELISEYEEKLNVR